jgi:hypothetical protein
MKRFVLLQFSRAKQHPLLLGSAVVFAGAALAVAGYPRFGLGCMVSIAAISMLALLRAALR